MFRALYERPAHVNRTDDLAVYPGLTPETVFAMTIAPDLDVRGDSLFRGNQHPGTLVARSETRQTTTSGFLELLPPNVPMTDVSRLAKRFDLFHYQHRDRAQERIRRANRD